MPVPSTLFADLVDDAALFPPGNAAMAVGLREHREHRASSYADLVGPFLCPASRAEELADAFSGEPPILVGLILDVTDEDAWRARKVTTALHWIEAAYGRLGNDPRAMSGGQVRGAGPMAYLEVPRTGFDTALAMVGTPGWHAAKYRTGGTTAEAFPSAHELAAFLVACARRDLPFKLTAGLHHAVRNTDAHSGFEQHGVLNVLVATRAAFTGAPIEAVADDLEQRDAAALVDTVSTWSEDEAQRVRNHLRSFGCCGVTEPIDELAALGLINGRTT